MITITSPITGSAQTGLTSPTYTVVDDHAPSGKPAEQVVVTALGGTQTGVTLHSVASPFTITFNRAASLFVLGSPNAVTGVINNVQNNLYQCIIRKGVTPLAGQPIRTATITVTASIPAGSDTADPANIRAMFSAAIGVLQQQSAGFGDMAINGVL